MERRDYILVLLGSHRIDPLVTIVEESFVQLTLLLWWLWWSVRVAVG